MKLRLLGWLLAAFPIVAHGSYPGAEETPSLPRMAVNPAAAAAVSSLSSLVFAAEADAVSSARRKRERSLEAFWATDEGRALVSRSRFAWNHLPHPAEELPYENVPAAAPASKKERPKASGEFSSVTLPGPVKTRLQTYVKASSEHCSVDKSTRRSFARHVEAFAREQTNSRARRLFKTQNDMSWSELLCLARSLLYQWATDRDATDPEPFYRAVDRVLPDKAGHMAFRADRAARYLLGEEYPRALAALYPLTDGSPVVRYLYKRIQRIYSLRHKGSGSVGIQGL